MILILTLIAFALSAFALCLAVFVNRRLVRENKELLKQLKAYEESRHDQQFFAEMTNNLANTCMRYMNLCYNLTKGGYVFKIVDRKDRCEVIKTTVDENTSCIIKEFTDPDQDYNRLCAEELVEKLNEN